MVNQSWSGPAHLAQPSISEESIHVNQRVRSEVHKETQQQPSPHLQEERSATNTKGPSYSSREREVERLREQVAMLQKEVERNEELLRRKDKKLHHQRGPSPTPCHSRGDECVVGDRSRKRDRRQPPPHREKTVFPPHKKNKREE